MPRGAMSQGARYAFGDVELDTGRVQVAREGVALALEPKAFAVLQLLVERAPNVVDKGEIFAAVWRDIAVTDNALTRIVAQLRRALGDDAKDPRYIATVSTRGYRLVPPVQRVDAAAAVAATPAAAAPAPVASAPTNTLRPARRWSPAALTLGALAAAVVIAAGVWLARRERGPAADPAFHSVGTLDLAIAASLTPQQMTIGKGYDGYVAFSPDGASIAYSSDRSGALEIYVEGLADGSTPASLTRGAGQCIQPAWSPDGRFLAYHEMRGNGIWIVPSRGGAARKIADQGARPTWSPDGRRIAYQSRPPADLNPGGSFGAESTIWIADVDGATPPRPLTRPGAPAGSHGMPQWWPRSDRVVFALAPPAGVFLGAALWTVDTGSGEARPLSAHPRLSAEFAVAPDGSGVIFAARNTNALWWLPIDADGGAGEPRPTALPVTGPSLAGLAMSADGRRIAWTASASSSEVWAAAALGTASTTVAAAAPLVPATDVGWRAWHPAVAPDGRVAFVGNRGGSGNRIFLAEDGRPPRQITTDARDHFGPLWIAGEDALAVVANHGDGLAWYRLDPATGRERLIFPLRAVPRPAGVEAQVIGPSAGQAMSRDLRRLAVAYVREGVANLWTTELGPAGPSGPLTQRTFESASGAFGSWSPDASQLAYQCARGAGTQLCVVDAVGPRPARQLTHDAGTHFIGEWASDDALLFAVKRDAVWNVMKVSTTTGQVTPLTAFAEPRFYVRYPHWDPVRRRVLFERTEATGRLWSVLLPGVSAAGSPAAAPAR